VTKGREGLVEQIVLPDLFCPFAPVVNKHAAIVQEETTRWASSFGLLPDQRSQRAFRATAAGRLAARFHPFAGREDLRLISDFYAWMFLQDDRRDESEVGRHPGRLSDDDRRSIEVLEGSSPEPHDGPPVHALGGLRERLTLRAPGPAWVRRFVRGVEQYFEASLWEAANRARGIVPDPEDYARMRPLTAGLGVDDELIQLTGEARLFGGAREHPAVRRLTLASQNAVCWANDAFSLKKELAHGDVHNLVVVLARAEGLGLQEALDRVAEVHDEEVRNFVRLSSRLPSFGAAVDEQLGRYVAVLRARIRGNLDWSRESARY
jgi:5-epi-alpha-selinene synthase